MDFLTPRIGKSGNAEGIAKERRSLSTPPTREGMKRMRLVEKHTASDSQRGSGFYADVTVAATRVAESELTEEINFSRAAEDHFSESLEHDVLGAIDELVATHTRVTEAEARSKGYARLGG